MKIAIVAPSPIPFGVGGAEKLWWGMQNYINTETNHHCELIKIPVDESNVDGLIKAYKDFSGLKLDHFDMVISTKYPAWMVKHSNHHSYVQHALRGLYDTYHMTGLPVEVVTENSDILRFLDVIDSKSIDAEGIFNEYHTLKNKYPSEPLLSAFPGPFIRRLIHALDRVGRKGVRSFSCISETVRNRTEYFPAGIKPEVIYHPSNLTGFLNGKRDYFFTVSRLDNAKRVRMIIEAYMMTKTDIPLKIAGTGPMEPELRKLAAPDSRIEFVGFVSDREIIGYYADALAVIFIPYDEDFGLITIEAMMSGKPVITFSDAGGVTEFVRHGVTGLISKPGAEFLAKNITYAAELFADGGCHIECIEAVRSITWKNTAERLIAKGQKALRKIVLAITYPVYPAQGGGQLRVYNLYKRITGSFTVHVLCIGNVARSETVTVCPGFIQHTFPQTDGFNKKLSAVESVLGIPANDLGFMEYYDLIPEYIEAFKRLSADADLVVASHPYAYPMIKKYYDGLVMHESHNAEYFLKKNMVKGVEHKILDNLYKTERDALLHADRNIVCCEEDGVKFKTLYGNIDVLSEVVPNCVDILSVPVRQFSDKEIVKKRLGITERVAIFVGSWHQPNIDAVYAIMEIAKKVKDTKFLIIGSVGEYFLRRPKDYPDNVGITGTVSDEEKELFLSTADIALNPMESGSGTNLKMLEYMAYGIPVLTTSVGARGLMVDGSVACIAEIDGFADVLSDVSAYENAEMVARAREHVAKYFGWESAAEKLAKIIEECLGTAG